MIDSLIVSGFDRLGRRIRCGGLTVELPDGRCRSYVGARPGPHARIDLHDTRLLRRLAVDGPVGLADSYILSEFDSPDLAALTELAARHAERGGGRVTPWLTRALQAAWRARAGLRGPLVDVVQHYDLGNRFYELWLDPTMTYSAGVFARDDMTLEEAQRAKYRRIAEATGLRRGERVLDVGCGWGGFALYAAEELGCHVTAITVSEEQCRYVGKLVAERGIGDLVETRLEDFRETRGSFDRVMSIEMIESIPPARWPSFFQRLRALTRSGGTIGMQAITVADRHWRSSDANPDFIRQYVFPGGQVPSLAVLHNLAGGAGLSWAQDRGYGRSYARTLGMWRRRFDERAVEVAELGFDERFRRMWHYYLAYCEGGFAAERVDVRQIVLTR